MHVAFDFNPLIKTKYSGFYTFGANLLRAFNAPEFDMKIKLFYSKRFTAEAEEFRAQLDPAKFSFHPTGMKINLLKTAWSVAGFPPLQWFTGDFDLYQSNHNMMPPTKGKPRVLVVYDLRRYRLPELYNKPEQPIFENAVRNADHIIAISEATRKDVCDIFHLPEDRVSAIPLACDPSLKPLADGEKTQIRAQLCQSMGIEAAPYLLTISASDQRKNIVRTIQAFKQVRSQLPAGMKLVVAGYLPKDETELAKIKSEAADTPEVVLAGEVEDMYRCIGCSEGLLFNSLYEGFGIPILEAFAFDVPVLTSNCSSMPEVGGDAALYADPYKTEEIAAGILRLFGPERTDLIERGRVQLKQFSWHRTAQMTFDIYRKLLRP